MIRKSGGGLSSSGSTPKKLVIKSLKNIPTISSSFEEECWEKLRNAILAIQQQRPISDSKESLYKVCHATNSILSSSFLPLACAEPRRCLTVSPSHLLVTSHHNVVIKQNNKQIVEDICAHKLAKPVYEKLRDLVHQQVQELFDEIKRIEDLETTMYLRQFNALWTSFCDQTNMIRNIFLYMDRTFVRQTLNQSLYNITLSIFSNLFEAEQPILNKVIEHILTLIQSEREGNLIDRSLLRSVVQMLRTTLFYSKYFEPEFFARTQRYYEEQAAQKIVTLEVLSSPSSCSSSLPFDLLFFPDRVLVCNRSTITLITSRPHRKKKRRERKTISSFRPRSPFCS